MDIGFSTLFGRMFVNLFLILYGVWCIILSIKNKQVAYFIGIFALMFLLVWNTKTSSGIFDILQTTTKYYQNVGYGKITYYPNTGIIIKVEKR